VQHGLKQSFEPLRLAAWADSRPRISVTRWANSFAAAAGNGHFHSPRLANVEMLLGDAC